LVPGPDDFSAADGGLTPEEGCFVRYGQDRQIGATDLRPYFLAQLRKGIQFTTVGHWGPREHWTAAEAFTSYLVMQGLVPSRARVAPSSGWPGAPLRARPA
jgi:hypothetical protein